MFFPRFLSVLQVLGQVPGFFSSHFVSNQAILVLLSVQTLTFLSPNAGGIKRKQQKKRIGGEDQEGQAGQGEGRAGEAGETEEEAAAD